MTPEEQAKRAEAAAKRRFEEATGLVWGNHQRFWLEAAALDLAAADEAVPVVAMPVRITKAMVARAWDAYWDFGPPFTAAGSKRAMRAALDAALNPDPR